mmetsp:Transcript_16227/g.42084  ORF Transcript_16227/g.42084 Transcript_16227/m.42084 type:complete len:247 (-) Transcript_16227:78-818(-)
MATRPSIDPTANPYEPSLVVGPKPGCGSNSATHRSCFVSVVFSSRIGCTPPSRLKMYIMLLRHSTTQMLPFTSASATLSGTASTWIGALGSASDQNRRAQSHPPVMMAPRDGQKLMVRAASGLPLSSACVPQSTGAESCTTSHRRTIPEAYAMKSTPFGASSPGRGSHHSRSNAGASSPASCAIGLPTHCLAPPVGLMLYTETVQSHAPTASGHPVAVCTGENSMHCTESPGCVSTAGSPPSIAGF